MATSYKDAFASIRGNQELAQKFVNDPKGTLESMGVDTGNLATTKAASSSSAANGVCVGCGICVG